MTKKAYKKEAQKGEQNTLSQNTSDIIYIAQCEVILSCILMIITNHNYKNMI